MAKAIDEAHRLYTRRINFREKVRWYLFQGRFFSCPLDNSHLYSAVRYVERNPVRAKIVKNAWDYNWSSAAYHAGIVLNDILVSDTSLLDEINDWKDYLSENDTELEKIRLTTRTGRPSGNNGFVKTAEKITKRVLQPGKAGRPRKKWYYVTRLDS